MKTLIVLAGVASLFAGGASALTLHPFVPAQTNFTADGNGTLTSAAGAASCSASAQAYTGKNGMAWITGVTFSGGAGCNLVSAAALPWKVMPTAANAGKIANMELTAGSAICGPSMVRMSINSSGVWTISGAKMLGGCKLDASLATTPAITPAP